MNRDVATVVTGMHFLEGPRWHAGRIWFSDFYGHQVYSATETGSDLRVEAEVPEQPSGLGWLPDGRLIVASLRDRRLLRREENGCLVTHADLSPFVANYINDMVIDGQGHAFVGEYGFDLAAGDPFHTACLMRVGLDGDVTCVAEDMWFTNGAVITESGTLLVCETYGNRVTAFDIDTDGTLINRRVWARFGAPPDPRSPGYMTTQVVVASDGCCLDTQGAIWIADAVGGRVIRVRKGGEILDEIHVATGAFACMLGGRDGRTLFVCAAPFDKQARRYASEAKLLSVRVEIPRAGRP